MLSNYAASGCFDELVGADGLPRHQVFGDRLGEFGSDELIQRQKRSAEQFYNLGITFAVYGDDQGIEKVWPFDVVPRIVSQSEWQTVSAGLRQRIIALNLFLQDIYNEKHILKDGIVPRELIETAKTYRPECEGHTPIKGVWTHVTGTDLVRDKDGQMYVLEDNLRCPSGVSYVLENREMMKRILPEFFTGSSIRPIEDYAEQLLHTLLKTAPATQGDPSVALLTPGIFNSAYFEHTFLAQQMGVELVQGSDLILDGGYVHKKTTRGLQRVDVIYRRIDDDFIDPKCFRADSVLGVPGVMEAYFAGRVNLANAPGTGIADDKAVYRYVPEMVRYYLQEDIILPNVPTYVCSKPDDLKYTLEHLAELVVKPTNESGGYGIVLGPRASRQELEECRAAIQANPRNFIAQPMLTLSTVPTIVEDHLEPRHVDLRPFILYSDDIYVMPGGLTRVALREGSMIVNSSQGGGSKDTWVLMDDA